MSGNLILHAQHSVNCVKLTNFFINGGKHYKHQRTILIPYLCQNINHEQRLIMGRFILPMWHTVERAMLSRGGIFSHSYISGRDFHIEHRPTELKNYNFIGTSAVSSKPILISEFMLHPSAILLFPIHCDVAKPLIDNQLL